MTAEALAAWRNVIDAAKIAQPLAGYIAGGDPLATCSACGYHDGAECLIVAGVISDTGTCNLWKPRQPDIPAAGRRL